MSGGSQLRSKVILSLLPPCMPSPLPLIRTSYLIAQPLCFATMLCPLDGASHLEVRTVTQIAHSAVRGTGKGTAAAEIYALVWPVSHPAGRFLFTSLVKSSPLSRRAELSLAPPRVPNLQCAASVTLLSVSLCPAPSRAQTWSSQWYGSAPVQISMTAMHVSMSYDVRLDTRRLFRR